MEKMEIKSFSTKQGEKEVRYSIEEIKNGFIITKNYESMDDKGHTEYKSERIYAEENPFEKESENLYEIIEAAIGDKPVE